MENRRDAGLLSDPRPKRGVFELQRDLDKANQSLGVLSDTICDKPDASLDEMLVRLCEPKCSDMSIYIVTDRKDPQSPVFVDIENEEGQTVRIGEFSENADGLTRQKISAKDIEVLGHGI